MNSHGWHCPARVSGGCRLPRWSPIGLSTALDRRVDPAPGTLVFTFIYVRKDQHARDGSSWPGAPSRFMVGFWSWYLVLRGGVTPCVSLFSKLTSCPYVDASMRWAFPGLCSLCSWPVGGGPSRGPGFPAKKKAPAGRQRPNRYPACQGHEAAPESLLTRLTEQGPGKALEGLWGVESVAAGRGTIWGKRPAFTFNLIRPKLTQEELLQSVGQARVLFATIVER